MSGGRQRQRGDHVRDSDRGPERTAATALVVRDRGEDGGPARGGGAAQGEAVLQVHDHHAASALAASAERRSSSETPGNASMTSGQAARGMLFRVFHTRTVPTFAPIARAKASASPFASISSHAVAMPVHYGA